MGHLETGRRGSRRLRTGLAVSAAVLIALSATATAAATAAAADRRAVSSRSAAAAGRGAVRHAGARPDDGSGTVSVAVQGNHLVNADGQSMRRLGVDRSGTEYACEQGWGIFDGPSDAASVAAMAGWHVNAVRIPLNEGCWLGQYTTADDPYLVAGGNPVPYEGAAYQSAITQYVSLLHQYGMVAILDLSVLNVAVPDAMSVLPMPDSADTPAFWTSVATTFEGDPGVVFDLYNEPNPGSSGSYPYDTTADWNCWLDGCTIPWHGSSYAAVGMQSLVQTVRATGATQPILLGSVDWSGDYGLNGSGDDSGWLTYESEIDPGHTDGIVADMHTYSCGAGDDGSGGCNGDTDYNSYCVTATCWQDMIAPLTQVVPVVTAEFGDYDCDPGYPAAYMQFADQYGISYLGWTWDATDSDGGDSWTCDNPSLIEDYDGTPTAEGAALQSHLAGGSSQLAVTTASLPSALLRQPYSATLTASGGDPPYRWSVASGRLPAGLRLSSTGAVTGTPTADGTAAVTVKVVDTRSSTHAQESATEALTVTVGQPVPSVTGLRPASGPGAGGTRVTVTGTGLEQASAVRFGSTPALRFTANAAGTSITATAPPGSGTVDVTVTTPGGTSTATSADQYRYLGPSVTSVAPTTGPAAGGTRVTIRGTDLNGATAVSFGPAPAGSFTVSAAGTSITALAPAGTDGTVDVEVTTPGGTSAVVAADQFTYTG